MQKWQFKDRAFYFCPCFINNFLDCGINHLSVYFNQHLIFSISVFLFNFSASRIPHDLFINRFYRANSQVCIRDSVCHKLVIYSIIGFFKKLSLYFLLSIRIVRLVNFNCEEILWMVPSAIFVYLKIKMVNQYYHICFDFTENLYQVILKLIIFFF